MPDQERKPTIEEVTSMLEHQRNMTNAAHMSLSHVSQELTFWKKLALHELGVDTQKVNELVMSSGLGLGTISGGYSPNAASTLRKY